MNHIEKGTQTCKNCSHDFEESFCNRCGQPVAHRITLGHVGHDVMHLFVHADKGIFSFIRRVVTGPGYLAYDYINGKRKIFNPYQYLLFTIGAIIFLMLKSGFYEDMQHMNDGNMTPLPGKAQEAMREFNAMVKQHTNLITYLSLPLLAFFSWLQFRSRGNNYAEHITLLVFTMAQINTINIVILLTTLIFHVSAGQTALLTFILTVTCITIVYKQFYKLKTITAFGKGLLVFVLFYIAEMIIMVGGFTIYFLLKG